MSVFVKNSDGNITSAFYPEFACICNQIRDLFGRKIWYVEHEILACGFVFRIKALLEDPKYSFIKEKNLLQNLEILRDRRIGLGDSKVIDVALQNLIIQELKATIEVFYDPSKLKDSTQNAKEDGKLEEHKSQGPLTHLDTKEKKECKKLPGFVARISKILTPASHPYLNICPLEEADKALRKTNPRKHFYLLCEFQHQDRIYYALKIKKPGLSQIRDYYFEFKADKGWFECGKFESGAIMRTSHIAYSSITCFIEGLLPLQKSYGLKIKR